jgi:hypothetical protein
VRIGVPYGPASSAGPPVPPNNFIDTKVFAELRRLGIPPSPLSDDSEFLRRVTLDVIGTLPTPEEVRAFLREPPSARKRQKAIDRLLRRPEFTDFWTLKLADMLLIDSKRLGDEPARAYHDWLREQVAQNTPLDQVVKTLLTAEGDVARNGPANFYRTASDPRDMAEFVSRTFLGVRVQCARCHHHPFDRWSQDDYHAFAALFARVGYDGTRVAVKDRGEVEHPKTGKPVLPRLLGDAGLPAAPLDRRAALSEWVTQRRIRSSRRRSPIGSGSTSWGAVSLSRSMTCAPPTRLPTPRCSGRLRRSLRAPATTSATWCGPSGRRALIS